jgi:hypothetical protein
VEVWYTYFQEAIMLTVRDALGKVETQFTELFGADIKDVRLEELQKPRKGQYHLTVSFLRPDENVAPPLSAVMGKYARDYKSVVLNGEDGTLVSVKIRE